MTRGDPYGETILTDRGDHPASAGERVSQTGQEITLEAQADLDAGTYGTFDGSGGVADASDLSASGHIDCVVAHDVSSGEDVTVHTYGVVRVTEDASAQDHVQHVDTYSNGDFLSNFN